MPNSRILLDLYASTQQPQLWSGVLDQICHETGACSAVIQSFRFDDVTGTVELGWQAKDSQTLRHTESLQVASVDNPRFARHRVMRALNEVVRDDELFDSREPEREQLRQALASMGLGEFLGTLQPLPDSGFLGVALHRRAGDRRRFRQSDARYLTLLAPHVSQACQLGQQLWGARAELRQMRQHADLLRFGLITCDAGGEVRWLNHHARRLLRQDARAGSGTAGQGSHPALPAWLRQAVAAVAHDELEGARFLAREAQRLHVAMRASPAQEGFPRTVMVVLTSLDDTLDVPPATWAGLLGLTLAESAIVTALANGHTLEAHAAQRGISLGTARNHLKQALAKTTTSRQADLVRLALGSAAAFVLSPGA